MFARNFAAKLTRQSSRSLATVNPPRLFDYATVTANLKPSKATITSTENAFGMLAKGEVDVPIPMHIGIAPSAVSTCTTCTLTHLQGFWACALCLSLFFFFA
jgi:hypothetical protein